MDVTLQWRHLQSPWTKGTCFLRLDSGKSMDTLPEWSKLPKARQNFAKPVPPFFVSGSGSRALDSFSHSNARQIDECNNDSGYE